MTMFILGLFVGGVAGFLGAALMSVAAQADRALEAARQLRDEGRS